MKQTLAVLALTIFLVVSQALAAPPSTINYQGYLSGSNSAPVNTPVAMTLTLYSAPVGGTALWSEYQSTVPVVNGVYSVLMGSVTPIALPFDTVYYLGVAVNSDPEMTPRQELASVPYSFRAMGADKLNQVCADGEILKYSSASSSWSCAAPVGLQGPAGINGTNGTVGATGPAGATGATGAAGTNGAVGATGAAGTNGAVGATGAAGTNGAVGA
ncbi:MAG: hypothetical protein J0665_02250, partial [Deltaproteobacteria bacterium]|nr:hypothetical protein [Deltaproteobacteria bacterium]